MSRIGANPYNSIFVVEPRDVDREVERLIEALGEPNTVRIDVSRARTRSEIAGILTDTFHFPMPALDLNASLSWMADLEWMTSPSGWIMVVAGTGEPCGDGQELCDSFVGMLPYLVDRWRARAVPFVPVLSVRASVRERVRSSLAKTNGDLRLAADGPLPNDFIPVEIWEL